MSTEHTDILIVEDSPNDAQLTIRSLKKHNLANNIVHVTDGQEALDYLSAQGAFRERNPLDLPRVILLDLKLPKLDGRQVLSWIRKNEATKLIPVVVLTSSQEEADLHESYKLGANSYIVKPVDFEKFTESIRQVGLYWLLLNKPALPVHVHEHH